MFKSLYCKQICLVFWNWEIIKLHLKIKWVLSNIHISVKYNSLPLSTMMPNSIGFIGEIHQCYIFRIHYFKPVANTSNTYFLISYIISVGNVEFLLHFKMSTNNIYGWISFALLKSLLWAYSYSRLPITQGQVWPKCKLRLILFIVTIAEI